MKSLFKSIFLILNFLLLSYSTYANEMVRWTGTVNEKNGYHISGHKLGHTLEFIRQNDGKKFDIVDGQELEFIHSQNEKNLLVEIEAEKSKRFLFWGGNLIVKNFKILQYLEDIPHREPSKHASIERRKRDRY